MHLDLSAGLEGEFLTWLESVGFDENGWPQDGSPEELEDRFELTPGDVRTLLSMIRGYHDLAARFTAAKRRFEARESPALVLKEIGLERPKGRPRKHDPWQILQTYRSLTMDDPPTSSIELFSGEPPVRRPIAGPEAILIIQRLFDFPSPEEALDFLEEQRAVLRRFLTYDHPNAPLVGADVRLPSKSRVLEI